MISEYPSPVHARRRTGFSFPSASRFGIDNIPSAIADDKLPPVAIGILSHNRAAEVLRSLSIFVQSDYPAEKVHIVVIDNASTDGTREKIREVYGDRVEVLRLEHNMGAVARNEVIMHRSERYVFQFDEDCAPEEPDAIRRAVEFMEANLGVGALCFRSVNMYTRATEWGDFGIVSRRRLGNGGYEGLFIIGNGMCYRSEAIQRTRGFDQRIHWGSEELQLGHEFLYHDIPIVYLPDLTLIHRHAPRVLTNSQVLEIYTRNNVMISFLYYPLPLAVTAALAHTAKRLLAAVVKSKPDGVTSILRGFRDGLAQVPLLWRTRKVVPVSKLAQHSRWFFATFHSMPPARSDRYRADRVRRTSRR